MFPSQSVKNFETDKYVLFLTSEFSQWYPCTFTAKEGQTFNCAEQYMMYSKAVLFGDVETAEKIMAAETPEEQKRLGREIKGFDLDIWNAHARDVVYQGNYYKFTQNPHLFEVLTATAGKKLVEAAHYDPIWGIGLRANDPLAKDKANWKGKNWLGGTLTKLRDDLKTQNFKPGASATMVKFYDSEGQRTLYIPAKELAQQWIENHNRHTEKTENPADPIAWMRQSIQKTINDDKGRPYDMHDDPRVDPTMLYANIKGHGAVETELRTFLEMNEPLLKSNLRQPPRTPNGYKPF